MTCPTKLILACVSTSICLGACRPLDDVDEFRNGIPRKETVEMAVPAHTGQALTIERTSRALQGETADLYRLTREVSRLVNGSGALVLLLVKQVISHRPTRLDASSAVWGPWSEPLEPIEWKVTVTRAGEHAYQYRFEGRDKRKPEAAYVTVLSGTHAPTVDAAGSPIEGYGSGSFTLDWDARNTLPLPEKHVGEVHYNYSRTSPTAAVEVDAQFKQVKDDARPEVRVDVDYRYRASPGVGGSMEFVHAAPATAVMPAARWAVKSRWTRTGAGRSDVRAATEALPGTQLSASECWDEGFASRFLHRSWDSQDGHGDRYGDEASACVFKSAEYSNL
jgi:hypothetical protein